ncbi:MAG: mevalonate kinase [Crocinitomicaceae bacterium]
MEKFTSKVLMFGEYSLLYNSMALTMPFDKFSGRFSYTNEADNNHLAILSNQGLRKFCQHMLENHADESFKLNVAKFKTELDKGLFFESNIPQGFGLGSSGALVAAIFLRYLDKAGDFKDEIKFLTKEKITLLKKCLGGLEGYFHGTSSGIDPLSILINAPLLLKSDNEIIPVEVPVFNPEGKNVVFLLNTGLARSTEKLVTQFRAACKEEAFRNKLQKELIHYTNSGIESFLKADTEKLYTNLDHLVQFQLNEMSYLIPESYKSTVKGGLENGEYFLKICGSGGGGYMLGFTDDWENSREKLAGKDLEILYRF